MELVPFNQKWADSGNKLDLRGLYQLGDRVFNGSVRRHNDWTAKGAKFVTLATAEDVVQVRQELRAQGIDLTELAKSYEKTGLGQFRLTQYLSEQPQRDAAEAVDLKARLAQLEKPKGGK
jgi:hypothetical protein